MSEGERERDKEEGADKLGGKEDSVGLPDDTSTRPSSAGRLKDMGARKRRTPRPATRYPQPVRRLEDGMGGEG